MSKHRRTETLLLCVHGQAHKDCPWCALSRIRGSFTPLAALVTAGRSTTRTLGGTRHGGTPSWEPVDIGALALLQDLQRAPLATLEHDLADEAAAPAAARVLRRLDERCQQVIGHAQRPYRPLISSDGGRGKPVPCPARDACSGVLEVHRENDTQRSDFGRPTVIRCSKNDQHEWDFRNGGFLRLRVALDTRTRKATA
jgi:hypothetical protein